MPPDAQIGYRTGLDKVHVHWEVRADPIRVIIFVGLCVILQ